MTSFIASGLDQLENIVDGNMEGIRVFPFGPQIFYVSSLPDFPQLLFMD
jgi:hypothetical protein